MKHTSQDAERARELFDELRERFDELKSIIRSSCESTWERDQFRHNCLSRCEPGLFESTDWMTKYDGIISLETWVERMEEEAPETEEDIDESETEESTE